MEKHKDIFPQYLCVPLNCATVAVGRRYINDVDTDNQVIDKWTTDGVKQVNTIHCEYTDLIVL
jgi:hypothetical protein